MILVYPMLVSGTVSPNVIPGIVKAVERYLLIYGLDDVLKQANSAIGSVTDKIIKVAMNRLVLDQAGPGTKGPQAAPQRKEKEDKKDIPISYTVFSPSFTNITLEPTWLTVSTSKKGLQVIGIKVVPFPIKSSTTLIQTLLKDTKASVSKKITSQYSRSVIRALFRILRKFHIPGIKDRVITGDPKIDVVWGATMYKHHVFTCFSKVEVEEVEKLFGAPEVVHGLHKMGWTSFIMTDDVKKTTTFCMEEFGGICSEIPYSYLFSALSGSTGKAFEDLESLQKSSGPFFKMKTSKMKIFEGCSKNKSQLQESILDTASKISREKLLSFLQKASDAIVSKDPNAITSKFSFIPTIGINKIHSFFNRISDKFSNTYQFSKTILENSTEIPDDKIPLFATLLTAGAILEAPENPKDNVKIKLEDFVEASRARMVDDFKDLVILLCAAALTSMGARSIMKGLHWKKVHSWKAIQEVITFVKKVPLSLKISVCVILFIVFLVYISKEA